MQFLKTLFWVVVATVAAIFAYRNWIPVEIQLWGGLEADVKLPVLMFAAFLIGFVPPFLFHKATRWQLKRKLDNMQRALEEARAQNAQASAETDGQNGTSAAASGPQQKLI